MTRALAALTVAALMAAFLMPIVQAQQPTICQPHAEVNRTLLDRYQEVVIAMGLAGNALFELYASKSGTWTVVVTRPSMNNLPCIQGTGTDLQLTGNKYPPPKADPE